LARSFLGDFSHPEYGHKTQIHGSEISSAHLKKTEIAGE